MTDARMPERYLNDRRIVRLSDGAFRALVTATMWSVANRTEGVIEHDDIALIPHAQSMVATELVTAGLWDLHERGYLILDFDETQTSKDILEHLDRTRQAEREKKARQRAAKRAQAAGMSPGQSPGTFEGTVQDRTGQARTRTGQDRTGSEGDHLSTAQVIPFGDSQHTEMQRNALASWGVTA